MCFEVCTPPFLFEYLNAMPECVCLCVCVHVLVCVFDILGDSWVHSFCLINCVIVCVLKNSQP